MQRGSHPGEIKRKGPISWETGPSDFATRSPGGKRLLGDHRIRAGRREAGCCSDLRLRPWCCSGLHRAGAEQRRPEPGPERLRLPEVRPERRRRKHRNRRTMNRTNHRSHRLRHSTCCMCYSSRCAGRYGCGNESAVRNRHGGPLRPDRQGSTRPRGPQASSKHPLVSSFAPLNSFKMLTANLFPHVAPARR